MNKYASQYKWAKAHPEKVKEAHARWREKYRERIRIRGKEYRKRYGYVTRVKDLRIKYGLTPQQYDDMLVSQNGVCAICGKSPFDNGKRLSIDHCHKTKKVRGLLCYKCNTGLASFSDAASILWTAYQYIAQAEVK